MMSRYLPTVWPLIPSRRKLPPRSASGPELSSEHLPKAVKRLDGTREI